MTPGVQKLHLGCMCVGNCCVVTVLHFEPWGDDPEHSYVEFSYEVGQTRTFRDRLRAAWRVVLGRDPWVHGVEWDHETLVRLRDWLDDVVQT